MSQSRISYFVNMVFEKNEYISLKDSRTWKKIETTKDYFEAMQYLQNEFKEIIHLVKQYMI